MEDTTQLIVTLNPPETAYPLPPHRRRPLRSNTCRTLLRILSHCRTNFPQQQEADYGNVDSRPVSEQNGLNNHNESCSVDALVPSPNFKVSEDTFVKKTDIGKSKENAGFLDEGFDREQTTVPKLDHTNVVTDGEQETPENRLSAEDVLVVENRTDDCALEVAKEQTNMNSVLDISVDDFGPVEQLEMDKEFSIHDFSEVLDSCFGMDMVVESSKAGDNSRENDTTLEENVPKESENKLQLKEMELEKLIYDSGGVDPPCCVANQEIEEGEISGGAGVADVSLDALSHDTVSHGGKTTEMMRASENSIYKDEFLYNDEDRGRGRVKDFRSRNDFRDSNMRTQRIGSQAPYLENRTPSGRILPESAVENQISAATEKEGDANGKKRKRPLTEERKAKKKKKDRLKRAENNRKLGVKRLKLPTIVKPKTIVYCRHYLQGRCHEGDKCKFSHDTVPLTKSKPCGHFARHACMKGDDCPFDHQLSKYPCKNYTSSGFCSRGSGCLFSHEMPAKTESNSEHQTTPDPKVNHPSPLNNSNSSKHVDSRGKINAKNCSSGNAPGKTANLLPTPKPLPRTPGQAPKGVSFILNGGMSLGETSKHKQDESSIKKSDGVDVQRETVLKAPGGTNKSNEVIPPRRQPQGINFLSFAQPPLDDSNSKTFSNLLSNSYNEKGKSVMDVSLPESRVVLKVDTHVNKSANFHFNTGDTIKVPSLSFGGSRDQSAGGPNSSLSNPFRASLLSNTPSLVQKAVQSTLAFAAKFEPDIKAGSSRGS